MTPSRQESNHPTSSSSSSTSPTTTVSSESETREKEDLSEIDSHPVPVSSTNVEEMIEQRDPLFAANPGSAAKPTKIPKTNKEETRKEPRDPLFAAKPAPLEPTCKRREDLGKHSVYTHFPEDQNYKGLVQKTKWRSRTSCRKILVT